MLAIAAAIVFAIGFILALLGVATGKFSLTYLGLTLFALHFVLDLPSPLRGRGRRR